MSIAFLLLSGIFGLQVYEVVDLGEEYPEIVRQIDESMLAPFLADRFDKVMRGVFVPDDWGQGLSGS